MAPPRGPLIRERVIFVPGPLKKRQAIKKTVPMPGGGENYPKGTRVSRPKSHAEKRGIDSKETPLESRKSNCRNQRGPLGGGGGGVKRYVQFTRKAASGRGEVLWIEKEAKRTRE